MQLRPLTSHLPRWLETERSVRARALAIYHPMASQPKMMCTTVPTGGVIRFNYLPCSTLKSSPFIPSHSKTQATNAWSHPSCLPSRHLSSHTTTLSLTQYRQVFHSGHSLPSIRSPSQHFPCRSLRVRHQVPQLDSYLHPTHSRRCHRQIEACQSHPRTK